MRDERMLDTQGGRLLLVICMTILIGCAWYLVTTPDPYTTETTTHSERELDQ